MPWKIRKIDLAGHLDDEPKIQLWDKRNAIYLNIELTEPREVHINIGNADPMLSRLYLVVDDGGVFIARAQHYRGQDISIMASILETMGYTQYAWQETLKVLAPRKLSKSERARRRPFKPPVVPEVFRRRAAREPQPAKAT